MGLIDLVESQSLSKCLDQGIRVCEWECLTPEHSSALYGLPENKNKSWLWVAGRTRNNLPDSYELHLDVTRKCLLKSCSKRICLYASRFICIVGKANLLEVGFWKQSNL